MTATQSIVPALKRILAAAALVCALAQAHAQPNLALVNPTNGATQVSLNSPVIFIFDTPMSGIPPLEVPGFLKGYLQWNSVVTFSQFSYAWSADDTILTCMYNGSLPGSTLITWTLNPSDADVELTDAEGTPLPTTTGSFMTAAGTGCDPDGIPDTFGNCSLSKSVTYDQLTAGAPTLSTNETPLLVASVKSPAANRVTNATLRLPNSSTKTLSASFGTLPFYLIEEFTNQAALDLAYPAGSYQMSMGRQSPPSPTLAAMTMPAVSSYPPVPQIVNFAAAQAIDPAQAFTLQWNPFTGAAGFDAIMLMIRDAQYNEIISAPDYCIPLPLPNTATSFVLPAGLLEPANTYTGRLVFAKSFAFSTNNPVDFATTGSLLRSTEFPLKTIGGTANQRPGFDRAALRLNAGKFQFTLTNLVAGQIYYVDYSTTLRSNSWNLLLTTNPPTTSITYTDPASGTGFRFYRARKN
jgi:hypothetical protein